jgi:hypothetical protein
MASASLMGGFMATVNVERRARGLPPLGFANPLLYRTALTHPSAFRGMQRARAGAQSARG